MVGRAIEESRQLGADKVVIRRFATSWSERANNGCVRGGCEANRGNLLDLPWKGGNDLIAESQFRIRFPFVSPLIPLGFAFEGESNGAASPLFEAAGAGG